MQRWIAIDPATDSLAAAAGIAWWQRGAGPAELVQVAKLHHPTYRDFTASKRGKLVHREDFELRTVRGMPLSATFATSFLAWSFVFDLRMHPWPRFAVDAVFIERGFGANPKAIADQAFARGMLTALAWKVGIEWVMEINNREWAKAVGAYFGRPFPTGSEARKAHAIALARELGIDLTDEADVADAVFVGMGAALLDNMLPPLETKAP